MARNRSEKQSQAVKELIVFALICEKCEYKSLFSNSRAPSNAHDKLSQEALELIGSVALTWESLATFIFGKYGRE